VSKARVFVATADRRPVERAYEASGTIRGRNTAVLTSKIVANVRDVRVRAGDVVRAGQLLAALDDSDAQAAVRRARAGLDEATEARTEAENAVRAADAGARVATTNHGRMERLLAQEAITQQMYDEAEARKRSALAERDMANARVRGSGARIEEARAAVSGAEAALGYTRIVAPFTGRVIDRRVDPGSQASPGMPLLVVEQDGALRVEASVDESRAGAIHLQDTAHVDLQAAGRRVDGQVAEIVPAVDPGSRAFLVKVELPADALASLRPGMFARVRFPLGTEERLVVPASAVVAAGQLDRVFVVEQGRARLRLVTVGQRTPDFAEMLSGIDAGEKVVVTPPATLRDGDSVEESK
jgi:multidrug efflux pump subunit AcrA (membrane-fusion protein)